MGTTLRLDHEVCGMWCTLLLAKMRCTLVQLVNEFQEKQKCRESLSVFLGNVSLTRLAWPRECDCLYSTPVSSLKAI